MKNAPDNPTLFDGALKSDTSRTRTGRMSVRVLRNRHGRLYFRLYWQGLDLREGTSLPDTPENRDRAEKQARAWSEEIQMGTFDYLKAFPAGNKAKLFRAEADRAAPRTIRRYYEDWITKFEPPLAKRSRYRNYRSHFDVHILPTEGDKFVSSYAVTDVRALLHRLVTDKGLTPKTGKNVLNGTLRAFLRDAHSEGLIERSPFDLLPKNWWPKSIRPAPDPFTEEERDQILSYLREKLYARWPAGYVFAYSLFWTGMRPSELTARKWGELDPRTRKLSITTSRTDGQEGPTKTTGSRRTIDLFPAVLEEIRRIQPLHIASNDHIFTDSKGGPIDHGNYAQRVFQPALRALKIRPRPFYNTRHSFISIMLSHGENILEVAQYVGNSPAMISQHYARWTTRKGTFGQAAMAGRENADRKQGS